MKGVNYLPDRTHAATRIVVSGKADDMAIRDSRASTAAARLSLQARICEAFQHNVTWTELS